MKNSMVWLLLLSLAPAPPVHADDFPQWRGVQRNGVVENSPPLRSSFDREGPPLLWESEVFPRRAGLGSPVIAGGRAFVYINWMLDRELEERRVTRQSLERARWFDPDAWPQELLERVEKARKSRSAKLSDRELDEWSRSWVEMNVSGEHRRWRGTILRRLRDGATAPSLEVLRRLKTFRDRAFESEEKLVAWLDENEISGEIRDRLLRSIDRVDRSARDVLLAVNLEDGKTAWKYEADARLEDRQGSSTPCVDGDRIYFLGTTHAHCVDRESGERVWATELPRGGGPSSFVIAGDHAIVLARHPLAFDRRTGEILWEQPLVKGGHSSPTPWTHEGKTRVLVNGTDRKLSCLDAATGEVLWTAKGGGDSSPVVSGDLAVVHTKAEETGLVVYRMSDEGAEKVWNLPRKSRGAATPIVTDDTVYLLGGEEALCASLTDGTVHWRQKGRVEISSPVLADDKIIGLAGNGRQFWMLRASRTEFEELAKTRLRATRCASPALAGGRLVLRLDDRLAGYDLRASRESS